MTRIDYSDKQLKAMFGKPVRPGISISLDQISTEAQKLAGKLSISGVQPKLSVRLEGDQLLPVARDGQYILKPQTQEFAQLPQNEYLCMQMGNRFGLNTARSILLELSDGSPAYLVKRFDRFKKGNRMEKLSCEDIHQVLGGPDKYAGSHEQIARVIRDYCAFAPLELQRFYEMTIFNFAIGNGDAHRKNFSLLTDQKGVVALSPAYDLVSSRLVIPEEAEEMALTLNGKRNRLKRDDFLAFAKGMQIEAKYAESKIAELIALSNKFADMITNSLLTVQLQERFLEIAAQRLNRLAK
ncbi:MAG: HipA domain-containing protein [Planctomycetes bacterium]|nr:HipA domain-containing protein [Planctomycetota bacterium]